jgi:NAD+ synthase
MAKTKIKKDSFKNLPENIKDLLYKHKILGSAVWIDKETFVDQYHTILVDNVLYVNEAATNETFDDELLTLHADGTYKFRLAMMVHAIIRGGNIIKNRYGYDTTHNNFDAKEETKNLIQWIKDWFKNTRAQGPAVIGISGGKDSTVVAKLCIEALGADNVIGVSMPDEGQDDSDAKKVAKAIGLKHLLTVPINRAVMGVRSESFVSLVEEGELFKEKANEISHAEDSSKKFKEVFSRADQNLPPRIRMAVLYYISQTFNGRVANTCNLSEDWLGYATIYGDGAGDFGPLQDYTVTEIKQIGYELGIPCEWVDKVPDDGLPNSAPDEEKFGFSYETLDKYIRNIEEPEPEIREKIDRMHEASQFKRNLMHIPKPWVKLTTLEDCPTTLLRR